MFGLPETTLQAIVACIAQHSHIQWAKIYGSRAIGNYQKGSDIDIAFGGPVDNSAALLGALDALPTPYLFDVTHYETLHHTELKAHIDRIGVLIYERKITQAQAVSQER
ncbi:MAG: hypothetical protein RL497_423 [Pseudomonadota bacterium]|jgi:predicted nucleotidyltransferase